MSPVARAITSLGLAGFAFVAGATTVDVLNEDFTHFEPLTHSAYRYVAAGSATAPGDIRVVADPGAEFSNGFKHYYDHTSGDATGAMLFFDGSSTSAAIWSTNLSLMADTIYTFSFWMSSATTTGSLTNTPRLRFSRAADEIFTSTRVGDWEQFVTTFTVADAMDVVLSIFDVNGDAYSPGNDGAIDDIALTFHRTDSGNPIPEPSESALMAGGFGVLAWMLRRRGARRSVARAPLS